MKRITLIATLGLTVMAATSAFAQSAREIDRHVADMRQYLHLSGQQAGTIRHDYFAASDEKKSIRRNPNLSDFDRDRRLREVNRATNEEIEAVLNPRQLDQFRGHPWRHRIF